MGRIVPPNGPDKARRGAAVATLVTAVAAFRWWQGGGLAALAETASIASAFGLAYWMGASPGRAALAFLVQFAVALAVLVLRVESAAGARLGVLVGGAFIVAFFSLALFAPIASVRRRGGSGDGEAGDRPGGGGETSGGSEPR
jgi:hypothetical protein